MTIDILSRAREDLIEGFSFYEEKEPGAGTYFRQTLFAEIDRLQITAGVHSRHLAYHRALSKTFPYAIYYRFAGDIVQVHAVLDCRRDPDEIRERLRE